MMRVYKNIIQYKRVEYQLAFTVLNISVKQIVLFCFFTHTQRRFMVHIWFTVHLTKSQKCISTYRGPKILCPNLLAVISHFSKPNIIQKKILTKIQHKIVNRTLLHQLRTIFEPPTRLDCTLLIILFWVKVTVEI
jgi:hypothetical protein